MSNVIVVGTHIVVDIVCEDCGHEWQEEFYEDHVDNATDREFTCLKCEDSINSNTAHT